MSLRYQIIDREKVAFTGKKIDVLERETPCLSLLDAGQCMHLIFQVTIFLNNT